MAESLKCMSLTLGEGSSLITVEIVFCEMFSSAGLFDHALCKKSFLACS